MPLYQFYRQPCISKSRTRKKKFRRIRLIALAAITKLTNLKILDLHGDTQLTSKNIIALAANPKIESLTAKVFCDEETDMAFKTFLEATRTTLKELKIKHKFRAFDQHPALSWTKYLVHSQCIQKISIKYHYGP